jgi:hypothetical protein
MNNEAATPHTAKRSGTLASPNSSSKLASVPLAQNFCLPAASQLPHFIQTVISRILP